MRQALRGSRRPVLLAVSGGMDSMTLMHAASRVAAGKMAGVASFDHGTGPAARAAAAHVARAAASLGLPVVLGRAPDAAASQDEDTLRRARWAFLHSAAAAHGAVVATAHTEDDHLETVVMRALRGAGARGLAALYAPASGILRPLLDIRREQVREYASERGIEWIEDPANLSDRYFRNRVRRDLLPALLAAQPSLGAELLDLSRRAAGWRRDVESFVSANIRHERAGGALSVAAPDLAGYDSEALAVLWPALASRMGLALDARGTRRLSKFTIDATVGAVMPLSGGWEVMRRRDSFELRRTRLRDAAPSAQVPTGGALHWGRWHFQPRTSVHEVEVVQAGHLRSPWEASLPTDRPITVRAWQPGDRLWMGAGRRRRVKRFLAEAGVDGTERQGWPVVLAGDEVIWIPGVRRSDAATERSGRPGVLYHCDVDDR